MARRKGGDGFTPKTGFSFASKNQFTQDGFGRVKAIDSAFGGSVPDSIYAINVASAWSRWRRGYELATAEWGQTAFRQSFRYEIPLPPGVPQVGLNPPTVVGAFQGFPTANKELGMHWAAGLSAGSYRFDNSTDSSTPPIPLAIASVNDTDKDFWFVTLSGNWSKSNPLPPPLFVSGFKGSPNLYPINGFVLEDRILTVSGTPITRETIDPTTQTRYGYMSAVLVETDEKNGILKLRKPGSVQATKDGVLVTPSRTKPQVGRFFMSGTRYCCSCQDFQRRSYFYVSSLGKRKGEFFPRTKCATLKPGRYEIMTNEEATKIMNAAMTDAFTDRVMHLVAPSGFPISVGTNEDMPSGMQASIDDGENINRDFPGVFRSFGDLWTRSTPDPSVPGAKAEGMPSYNDYTSSGGEIKTITDFWTPMLDEKRFCKHIYAMKYLDNLFPPEPSDFPIGASSMAQWEQDLVEKTQNDQQKALENITRYGIAYMDVPPFNVQAPMMMPMMQQLFNIPTDFITMSGFVMIDKNGKEYRPVSGEKPGV